MMKKMILLSVLIMALIFSTVSCTQAGDNGTSESTTQVIEPEPPEAKTAEAPAMDTSGTVSSETESTETIPVISEPVIYGTDFPAYFEDDPTPRHRLYLYQDMDEISLYAFGLEFYRYKDRNDADAQRNKPTEEETMKWMEEQGLTVLWDYPWCTYALQKGDPRANEINANYIRFAIAATKPQMEQIFAVDAPPIHDWYFYANPIPDPSVEWTGDYEIYRESMEGARELVGFDIALPPFLEGAEQYVCLERHHGKVSMYVTCGMPDGHVYGIHKSEGIDYGKEVWFEFISVTATPEIEGVTVSLYSDESGYWEATWSDGGYYYYFGSDDPQTEEVLAERMGEVIRAERENKAGD